MEEKSQKVSLIDEAITRYFEKKKKNELIILDTIDRINSKKAAAFEMADATYSTIIEKRQNAITHINEQVDLIFEKREKEKIVRNMQIEEAYERMRVSEIRLREEIKKRVELTIEIVQAASKNTLQKIETAAQLAIERNQLSNNINLFEEIDRAIASIELKKQKAKEEAERLTEIAINRIRAKEIQVQKDAREEALLLTKRIREHPFETDTYYYEPSIIEAFGSFIGNLLASIIKVPFEYIERITGVKPIGDVGRLLANVTKGSIDTAAIAIDGSIGIISGVITGDDEQINRGETQVVKAGRRVLRGTVMSISNTGKSVRDVVSGDVVRVKRGVKSLVTKTAAVSISLLLPGAFDLDFDIDSDFVIDEQDPGIHHVEPQDVQGYTKADGTEVEGYHRGGETGYLRTDPDDDPDNNFS